MWHMLLCGVRLSVCPSFHHHVHVFCRNKHIFKIVSPSGSHSILIFPYQTLWQYSNRNPLTGAKIANFDQYLALALITAGPLHVVNITVVEYRLQHLRVIRLSCNQQMLPCYASVNLVDDNRTEVNCMHL